MTSAQTDQNNHSIAHYSALKTAVANGEAPLVEELLANQSMQQLEKNYLLDLARLGSNSTITKLLEAVPVQE